MNLAAFNAAREPQKHYRPCGVQLELPGLTDAVALGEVLGYLLAHDLDPDTALDTRVMHAQHARMLCEFFGRDTPITSIRYEHLNRYFKKETERGLARESVRKRLSTLSMAMKSAIRRDLLTKLPPWPVIKSDTKAKKGFWTLTQFEAAFAVCDDDDFATWVACGFFMGMHTSDLNRVRYQDIDLFKKTWIRRNTKNKKEPIPLPLPERLHKILLARFGEKQPHPRDLVAGRDMGNPNRTLKELAHRAGVPPISPIGLRHSCATWLEESGASEKFQDEWMGHAGSRIRKKHYHHLTDKMMADGVQALNAR